MYSAKKAVLKNFALFTGKHLCWNPSVLQPDKKENAEQVFSCECSCEMFNNTYFAEHLGTAVSKKIFHRIMQITSHFLKLWIALTLNLTN